MRAPASENAGNAGLRQKRLRVREINARLEQLKQERAALLSERQALRAELPPPQKKPQA